jgi:glycosyltransferase involved in cell wall biosynthesis
MRVDVLIRGERELNAIDAASSLLGEALRHDGHDVHIVSWQAGQLRKASHAADVLIVPYNPFMWGRWGFAPALAVDLFAARLGSRRPRIALLVHEPYVPIRDARSAVMGAWQRAQLGLLMLIADIRFASIEAWASRLSRIRPTSHLPSGSNVPDARVQRSAVRTELGVGDGFVVATLSTGHPSHLVSYVKATLARLAECAVDTTLLLLGAGASHVAVPSGIRVERPGYVPNERLGALIAAADLFLAPFVDGVSTRRGSMMAALCQGVSILGTDGELTDGMLRSGGLELVEIGSPARFADQAVALATDPERRAASAAAGRTLFEAQFTWPVIAGKLLEALE